MSPDSVKDWPRLAVDVSPAPGRFEIVSDGTSARTRVTFDGQEVPGIMEVRWTIDAATGRAECWLLLDGATLETKVLPERVRWALAHTSRGDAAVPPPGGEG